jgi:hypothetical protein
MTLCPIPPLRQKTSVWEKLASAPPELRRLPNGTLPRLRREALLIPENSVRRWDDVLRPRR